MLRGGRADVAEGKFGPEGAGVHVTRFERIVYLDRRFVVLWHFVQITEWFACS
jgi:hypothetical protein